MDEDRTTHLRRRGFTLTELMIVVAIIGVIVAAAVPALVANGERRVTMNVARTITEHLRGLRHLAVNSNRAYIVRITQGDGAQGATRGRILVYPSNSTRCIPASTNHTLSLSLDLDNRGAGLGRRTAGKNVQIVYLAPTPTLNLCFKPNGSIVGETHGAHLLPGSQSASDCTGEGYVTDLTDPTHWKNRCGRAGTMCLKIAYLNDACPSRCQQLSGDCTAHLGLDRIISLNFSGETRVIQ
jgi:prepilin-type N-terminal cleavage/methylation domain-containing protein